MNNDRMAKGIPTAAEQTPTESTSPDRLSLLKSRLKVAKEWSKKPHEAFKRYIAEYEIEDFRDTDEIRDKVRIGYIFRKIESEQPSIFDDQPDIFIKGRHPNIKEIEPLIEGTYDYLWDAQNLEEKIEDVGVYASLLGMAFLESPWVTKTKNVPQPQMDPMTGQPVVDELGQPVLIDMPVAIVDQPMAEVCDIFKVHFSPETKFAAALDYEHCPYYFKEMVMTKEEIKARFGKDVDPKETLKTNDSDTDNTLELDSVVVKDDMKRVTVYEYYGCLPETDAKGIKGAGKWTYDKDYHVFMTMDEELKAEECQYDQKPLFVLGNYGMANKFWKFGEAKHLLPLVQEQEMYRSQILKHTRKMANPKPLLPDGANIDENAFLDPRVGIPVKFSGPTAPSYLNPAPLGKEVSIGVDMVGRDLERQSAQFDLSTGGGESTVKTPRGIQVYADAADKQVRRKRKKIARLIKHLISFQFAQVSQNWKPEDARTLAIIDGGETQNVQVTKEVLEVLSGVNQMYSLDIEIESLSVNRVQQKQDALNLWDTVKDRPDIFNLTEVAKDLLQNGYNKKDADRYLISQQQMFEMMVAQNPDAAVQIALKAKQAQAQAQTQQQLEQPQDGLPALPNESAPQPQ